MQIPLKLKLEKLASRDETRPVLACLYLRITGAGDDRKGWLEGTDSYKLGRVPVVLEEEDTEGFVSVEAVTLARKLKCDTIRCNGSLELSRHETVLATLERPAPGPFPDCEKLMEGDMARIEGMPFTVGINPRLLLELAEGMGAETVVLEFRATQPHAVADGKPMDMRPSPLRPIHVSPLGLIRNSGASHAASGIIMPVRV